MPTIKHAAAKALRQSKRQAQVNRVIREAVKDLVRAARKAVAANKAAEAKELVAKTATMLDKSVRKGVFKKNTAARLKSRLAKGLAKLTAKK